MSLQLCMQCSSCDKDDKLPTNAQIKKNHWTSAERMRQVSILIHYALSWCNSSKAVGMFRSNISQWLVRSVNMATGIDCLTVLIRYMGSNILTVWNTSWLLTTQTSSMFIATTRRSHYHLLSQRSVYQAEVPITQEPRRSAPACTWH